jgi:hypothetical protein
VGTCLFAKALRCNSCVYLLRIRCLAADVVLLFVSRSLPSNGPTRYNIYQTARYHIAEGCVKREKSLLSLCHIFTATRFAELSLASASPGFLDSESRRYMPLRNVWLSPNYAALQPIILAAHSYRCENLDCVHVRNWSVVTSVTCPVFWRSFELYPVLSDSLLFGRVKFACSLESARPSRPVWEHTHFS